GGDDALGPGQAEGNDRYTERVCKVIDTRSEANRWIVATLLLGCGVDPLRGQEGVIAGRDDARQPTQAGLALGALAERIEAQGRNAVPRIQPQAVSELRAATVEVFG